MAKYLAEGRPDALVPLVRTAEGEDGFSEVGTVAEALAEGGQFRNACQLWDRVLADRTGGVEYGPPQSLVDQMRAASFAPAEFDALSRSLEASDDLAGRHGRRDVSRLLHDAHGCQLLAGTGRLISCHRRPGFTSAGGST